MRPYAKTVMSVPSRFTSAGPSGSTKSGSSGTSPFTARYVALCSRKMTGSGSRSAPRSIPVIERAVHAATPGHADDEGHAVSAVAAVADTRGLVDDLLEGGCAEIRELHLGDRQEPAERCTDGDADDRRLRDRCVDDPVAPELLDEPIGHAEHTAAD